MHVVDGRIYVEKRIDKEALSKHVSAAGRDPARITLTLTQHIGASARSFALPMPVPSKRRRRYPSRTGVVIGEWVEGLPKGTCTLTESVDDVFEMPEFQAVEYTGEDEATRR